MANTISDELNRLIQAKAGIKSALEEKGLTIGDSSTLDEFPGLILEMQTGGGGSDTSTLIDLIEGDITSIEIPYGTTKIGKNCFSNRTSLTNINIPNSVTEIWEYAFNNTALTTVNIPNSVTTIKGYAFASANSIKSLTIPNSVTKLELYTFYSMNNLEYLKLSESLSTLPSYSIYSCPKLKKLVIPDNVSTLETAFCYQLNLDSMIIGSGIKNIKGQINNMGEIYEVVLLAQDPPQIVKNYWKAPKMPITIFVKNLSVDLYKTTWDDVSILPKIKPLAAMNYDASTYTVTASGRDNLELYIDASLINSSTYTFTPGAEDSSHVITVKSVDPSLGVLDEVFLEVLIEGEIDYSTLYFGLTAIQDASVGLTGQKTVDMKYSSDGENWTQWDYANETLNLPAGETLYFKGDNSTGFYSNNGERRRFVLNTGKVNASGNIQSLVYDDNFVNNNTIPCNYCFAYLFYNCTALTTAPVLPATTLAQNCYQNMFVGCTSLTTAPVLPATTLANGCYSYMFGEGYGNKGCTSLTTAPVLPATTLAQNCYQNMFNGCTGLTTAPELPATTLASLCYFGMFYGCTGLTTAPELAATTLASLCYQEMFCDCTGLTTAPELPATTLVESCYRDMFNGCTGLTTAPELPATTLVGACYWNMFRYCSNLNYIKAMFTSNPDQSMWVQNVSSTGTFVMNAAATWDPEDYRGTSGIPAGWTVEKVTA